MADVNVAKTRGMVFQHAASAAVPLHLTYDGSEVEVVDAFCYLGRKEDLHVCPDKASWLMQGLRRERHAQTNQKPKQIHKTPNSIM